MILPNYEGESYSVNYKVAGIKLLTTTTSIHTAITLYMVCCQGVLLGLERLRGAYAFQYYDKQVTLPFSPLYPGTPGSPGDPLNPGSP